MVQTKLLPPNWNNAMQTDFDVHQQNLTLIGAPKIALKQLRLRLQLIPNKPKQVSNPVH